MTWQNKPQSGGYYWMKTPAMWDETGNVVTAWMREIVKVFYCNEDEWEYVRFEKARTLERYSAAAVMAEFQGPILPPAC